LIHFFSDYVHHGMADLWPGQDDKLRQVKHENKLGNLLDPVSPDGLPQEDWENIPDNRSRDPWSLEDDEGQGYDGDSYGPSTSSAGAREADV